jgi:hypothetical protein
MLSGSTPSPSIEDIAELLNPVDDSDVSLDYPDRYTPPKGLKRVPDGMMVQRTPFMDKYMGVKASLISRLRMSTVSPDHLALISPMLAQMTLFLHAHKRTGLNTQHAVCSLVWWQTRIQQCHASDEVGWPEVNDFAARTRCFTRDEVETMGENPDEQLGPLAARKIRELRHLIPHIPEDYADVKAAVLRAIATVGEQMEELRSCEFHLRLQLIHLCRLEHDVLSPPYKFEIPNIGGPPSLSGWLPDQMVYTVELHRTLYETDRGGFYGEYMDIEPAYSAAGSTINDLPE